MKEIKLTKGMVALVDDEDFDRVNAFKWHVTITRGKSYARARVLGVKTYMHSFLLGTKGIDHRDGDGLNNQRSNLRLATQSQNLCGKRCWGKSGMKGVWFWKKRGVYQVKCGRGNSKTIGQFPTLELAAKAYDEAALKLYGEFARTNY